MNTKKITSVALIVGLLGTTYMPLAAHAIGSKTVIKSHVTEYKIDKVNMDWWKGYNDEYLDGYIAKAVNENQDLKVATLKVEESRQLVKLQFSKELPSAMVGASPAVSKMAGSTSSEGMFMLPVIVSYEADIFLKNHDKTKSAKKSLEVSKFNEKAAYISVASAVGGTYFNIVRLDKLISVQNEIIASRQQIYEMMKKRNEQGITSTADVVRANKALALATTDLIDLKKARTILLNSLAVMTGDTPNNIEDLKRISYDDMAVQKPIPLEISSDIITQRPDYLAAEKQVEKAGLDVKIAKKDFLPTINLGGALLLLATSGSNSLSWANAIAGIGGMALLPIFTGGAKVANLRLNKNKYEQILQNYYKTNLVAIQEVNNSLSNLKLDDEKYHKNLTTLDMQKADFKYTQHRYNQGIISNLDLLQQKENLLVMNKMVISSKTDCYIDQISLYKAVGGKL